MKYRLLVVDDEHLLRVSLESGMADRGYEVRTAETIAEALRIAEQFRPDACFWTTGSPERTVWTMWRISSGSTKISW